MTAPRTCRHCGTALSPDVRWCGMCKEPVLEFATREAIHDPVPVPPRPARIRFAPAPDRTHGYRSRWSGGPTSFGPLGRITLTVLVGAWLLNGFLHTFFLMWLPLAFVGSLVLRDIWKPIWVPAERIEEVALPSRAANTRPAPAKVEIPTRTKVAWVCLAVVGIVAGMGFAYGSVAVKSAVLMAASLSALALWYANLT